MAINLILEDNFIDKYNKYIESKRAIKRACINILKDICNRTDSKEINLEKLKKYCCDYGLGYPVFSYEGMDIYSTVDGFRLEGNKIVFEIENSPSYNEDKVMTNEIIDLCEVIIKYEKEYTLGVADYGDDE